MVSRTAAFLLVGTTLGLIVWQWQQRPPVTGRLSPVPTPHPSPPPLLPRPLPTAATIDPPPEPTPAPVDLDALRAACVAEARSGGPPSRDPDRACQRYAEASRTAVVPPAPGPTRRASAPTARPPAPAPRPPAGLRAPVRDCAARVAPGSIAYRECRADESARLWKACRDWEQRRDRLNLDPAVYAHAAEQAQAYCFEARRYRIVE